MAFPAAPEFQEVTERVGGATIRVRVANFGGEDGDGLSFTVADEQYSFRQSLDQVEAMLDAYQAAYVEGYGAHLLGQGSLNINGRPGRELILDLDGYAMVYVRVIVSPNQVIVLTAVVPTGTAETGEVGRFFESFQLVEVN